VNSQSINKDNQGDDEEDDDEDDDDEGGGAGKRLRYGPGIGSMDEEMSRYVSKKGNLWSSSIIVLARQKFLGFFTTEEMAKTAFIAAYHQRESSFSSSSLVDVSSSNTVLSVKPTTVGNQAWISSQPQPQMGTIQGRMLSKFKGKITREVKLSDGSFIHDDFYRYFGDDSLLQDLASLLLPPHAANYYITDWITTALSSTQSSFDSFESMLSSNNKEEKIPLFGNLVANVESMFMIEKEEEETDVVVVGTSTNNRCKQLPDFPII
jgi:hypothetical protein